ETTHKVAENSSTTHDWFRLLGAHQATFEKYTNLQINLVLMGNSTESLVYDVLQLNVLHTSHLMIQLARYSRYRSRRSLRVPVNLMIYLMEPRRLRLPDEPQEGRNRSWAVEEFSATYNHLSPAPYGSRSRQALATLIPVGSAHSLSIRSLTAHFYSHLAGELHAFTTDRLIKG
ncbi:hypothetical protein T265_14994, partial [Opisthorchis viverrini]